MYFGGIRIMKQGKKRMITALNFYTIKVKKAKAVKRVINIKKINT